MSKIISSISGNSLFIEDELEYTVKTININLDGTSTFNTQVEKVSDLYLRTGTNSVNISTLNTQQTTQDNNIITLQTQTQNIDSAKTDATKTCFDSDIYITKTFNFNASIILGPNQYIWNSSVDRIFDSSTSSYMRVVQSDSSISGPIYFNIDVSIFQALYSGNIVLYCAGYQKIMWDSGSITLGDTGSDGQTSIAVNLGVNIEDITFLRIESNSTAHTPSGYGYRVNLTGIEIDEVLVVNNTTRDVLVINDIDLAISQSSQNASIAELETKTSGLNYTATGTTITGDTTTGSLTLTAGGLTNSDALGMKLSAHNNGYGIGVQSFLLQFITPNANADFAWGHGPSEALTEVMRLDGGTQTLTVDNVSAGSLTLTTGGITNSETTGMKLSAYGSDYGIGIQSDTIQFIVPGVNQDFTWGFGTSESLNEVMRLDCGTRTLSVDSVIASNSIGMDRGDGKTLHFTSPYNETGIIFNGSSAGGYTRFNMVNWANTTFSMGFHGYSTAIDINTTRTYIQTLRWQTSAVESDERLKSNITILNDDTQMGLLRQINPISFNFRPSERGANDELQIGFSADNLTSISMQLGCMCGEDITVEDVLVQNVKIIKPNAILSVAVSAIKDVDTRVTALQATIDTLMARITALESL